jgi:hypothetical protein
MLKHVPVPISISRMRLTWSEKLLLVGAAALAIAALIKLGASPAVASVMLLASAALVALVYERSTTRRTLVALAEQLQTNGPLSKVEVEASSVEALGHALNQAIQRSRLQTVPPAIEQPSALAETLPVAVLSIGLRQGVHAAYTAAHTERLTEVALAARQASRPSDAILDAHGDGTLLLIFGSQYELPLALSMQRALDVALTLAARYPDLRFGLGCGQGRRCALPEIGPTIIGAPLEEAVRLYRMAASWQEYQLLCTEPVALMARSFHTQRTMLNLTYASKPTLPIHAISLDPAAVAMSA